MMYTSTGGEEQLFPQYYILPSIATIAPGPLKEHMGPGRGPGDVKRCRLSARRRPCQQADLMGMFVAGWADAGLHPETFWLGYATGPAAAWHRRHRFAGVENSFYPLFYGAGVSDIGRSLSAHERTSAILGGKLGNGAVRRTNPDFGN